MIDVLAFPPTAESIGRVRDAGIARAERFERAGRVARFVTAGMFLGWVADVTAAFAPGAGMEAPLYGVASLGLAVVVVGAYAFAERTLARADAIRRTTEWRFSVVRVDEAKPLLSLAASDAIVSQYLRMVGRQQRHLYRIELTALLRWAAAPAATRGTVVSLHESNEGSDDRQL